MSLEENVAIPERDLELQWRKLEAKFHSLVDPLLGPDAAGELVAWCHDLQNREDLSKFWDLLRG